MCFPKHLKNNVMGIYKVHSFASVYVHLDPVRATMCDSMFGKQQLVYLTVLFKYLLISDIYN